MKKSCPECGHRMPVYADECPKCACWLDGEARAYLLAAVFIIYVATFVGILWIFHREEPPANPKPAAALQIRFNCG